MAGLGLGLGLGLRLRLGLGLDRPNTNCSNPNPNPHRHPYPKPKLNPNPRLITVSTPFLVAAALCWLISAHSPCCTILAAELSRRKRCGAVRVRLRA